MHDLSLKESRMYLQVLALILKPALPQFVTARCVAFSVSLAFLASRNAARDPTKFWNMGEHGKMTGNSTQQVCCSEHSITKDRPMCWGHWWITGSTWEMNPQHAMTWCWTWSTIRLLWGPILTHTRPPRLHSFLLFRVLVSRESFRSKEIVVPTWKNSINGEIMA